MVANRGLLWLPNECKEDDISHNLHSAVGTVTRKAGQWLPTDYFGLIRPSVGRLFAICRPTIYRQSAVKFVGEFFNFPQYPQRPGQQAMGLLQLAVTWYMLEGKLPTGTSKTKKIQIYLDEVALFWMSQWAACPPAYTM